MAETAHRPSRWARISPWPPNASRAPTFESTKDSTYEPEREKLVTKLLRACPLTLGVPSVLKTIEEELAKRKAAEQLKPPKTKSSWTSRLSTTRTTRTNTRRPSPINTNRNTRANTRAPSPTETAITSGVSTVWTTRAHSRRTSPAHTPRASRVSTALTTQANTRRTSPATTTRNSRVSTALTTQANTRRTSPVDTARSSRVSTTWTNRVTSGRPSLVGTIDNIPEGDSEAPRASTSPISPIHTANSTRANSRRPSLVNTNRTSWTNITRSSRADTARNSRTHTRRNSPVDTGRSSRTVTARNSRFNTRRRNSAVNLHGSSIAFEVVDPEDSLGSAAGARVSTVTIVRMAAVPDRLRAGDPNSRSSSASRPTSAVGGPVSGMIHRPSLAETFRTASNNSAVSTGSTTAGASPSLGYGYEKPLASGNGVSLSINLAEPVLFLQGFDQSELGNQSTTMLRGSFHLRVSKTAKIKSVSLKFSGRAETEWPEGIPPRKSEFKDKESIMSHTWTFFNAQFPQAEHGSGADVIKALKGPTATCTDLGVADSTTDLHRSSLGSALTAKEAKRLSLGNQGNQARSFGKGDTGGVAQKGYRTFTPGDYVYNFELPIDSRMPETIEVELGSVKYELEAIVERAGAFRSNLVGTKEVTLIRAPSEGSLEQVEPIAISRNWEDQLHYDIVISGKSFPLGAQVPIAFKLTPLAKVQCHRVKVFVTENIQYYTSNKRVHRLEPTRKIQLFEKRADGPSTSAYPGSSMRITAGGGIAYDYREAAARGEEHVPRDTTNLLGNLDDGEANIGPTEMEFNVQLPSCHSVDTRERLSRLHFDTTYAGIQVHHWIKIVMRLSKPDVSDSSKRRHFEISIDSPFHILSCRATQANTALPAYSSPESTTLLTEHSSCGCPGAPRRRNSPSSLLPTLNSLRLDTDVDSSTNANNPPTAGLTRPPAAHVHDPNAGQNRPMHLLRTPSFNPPPFEDEDPPPPLMTPPPNYDSLVEGDPRGGLADYFARRANEVAEDEDRRETMSPRARMELPLTPGGRMNRSMDERRTWVPLGDALAQ